VPHALTRCDHDLVALALAVSPLTAVAAEKQITDIKQLAGAWQGPATYEKVK
jgi:hypothetical protein